MPEPVNILFKSNPTKIDSLTLDCTITEQTSSENEITDHPVEDGFNVSDHIRGKPDKITITGLISNTPIGQQGALRSITTDDGNLRFESSVQEDHIIGMPGRAEEAISILKEIRSSGKIITITTRKLVLTNMAMESLQVPRDRNTGDAAMFTATFKQIRVVKNKTTRKVVSKEPKAQPKAKTGKQTTPQANEAQKKKSIAYSTAEKLGLLEKIKAL